MEYSTIIPNSALQHAVECYWTVVGDEIEEQKIVPDGFPEIVFHFGDVYELVGDNGIAIRQEKQLLSGQILRPIVLRPTGTSDVLGIKFKPAGLWTLLGIDMANRKDQIVPLEKCSDVMFRLSGDLAHVHRSERISLIEELLLTIPKSHQNALSPVIDAIDKSNGGLSIESICEHHGLTERSLQRMFRQQVGITAKQYSRIVRFRSVYALLQKPSLTKSDSLYLAGYFDQPHFNKEFRVFTNDHPGKWFSQANAFANLFMNR